MLRLEADPGTGRQLALNGHGKLRLQGFDPLPMTGEGSPHRKSRQLLIAESEPLPFGVVIAAQVPFGDVFPGIALIIDLGRAGAGGAGAGGAIVLAGERDAVAAFLVRLLRGWRSLRECGDQGEARRRTSRRARRRQSWCSSRILQSGRRLRRGLARPARGAGRPGPIGCFARTGCRVTLLTDVVCGLMALQARRNFATVS